MLQYCRLKLKVSLACLNSFCSTFAKAVKQTKKCWIGISHLRTINDSGYGYAAVFVGAVIQMNLNRNHHIGGCEHWDNAQFWMLIDTRYWFWCALKDNRPYLQLSIGDTIVKTPAKWTKCAFHQIWWVDPVNWSNIRWHLAWLALT